MTTKLDNAANIQAALARYSKLPKATEGDRDEIELHFMLPENASAKWLIPAVDLIRGIAAATIPDCQERYGLWPQLEGRNVVCMMKRMSSSILMWFRQGMDLELGPEWTPHRQTSHGDRRPGWEREETIEFTQKAKISLEMLVALFEAAARADANAVRRITAEEKLAAVCKVEVGADATEVAREMGAEVADLRVWRTVVREAALNALDREYQPL